MSKINYGIKIWSINTELLKKINDYTDFDYVEIYLVPNSLNRIKKIINNIKKRIVIHAPGDKHGFNLCDNSIFNNNLTLINEAIEFADITNSEHVIVHPGYGGTIKDTIDFLKRVNESRITIENMPKIGLNNENCIGYSSAQIKNLIQGRFHVCLDFGHAICAAASLKKDYKKFVSKFLELEPTIFHLSDGYVNEEKDHHLNIGEGDYDFSFLKKCVQNNRNKMVTLETPKIHLENLDNDILNIQRIRKVL